MPQMTLPAEGGCRCGRVRFRVEAPPLMTGACHCRGCQSMTGSAFSLTVSVPDSAFTIITGEPVVGGLHLAQFHHWHCPHCLSWTHTSVEPSMGFVNVRAGALDDPSWFTPFIEQQTAEKMAWVSLPVRHSYPGWPSEADYPTLIAEYAAG